MQYVLWNVDWIDIARWFTFVIFCVFQELSKGNIILFAPLILGQEIISSS